ncbi:hypothetical protein GCM10009665_18880 [Kitasatospora nipponensis]|uniref:Uncharacterized protein n=1 Tax=Kitasatospora nipponensis TaxID=258049 RepID=A0ABN1VZN8_9ACTN
MVRASAAAVTSGKTSSRRFCLRTPKDARTGWTVLMVVPPDDPSARLISRSAAGYANRRAAGAPAPGDRRALSRAPPGAS